MGGRMKRKSQITKLHIGVLLRLSLSERRRHEKTPFFLFLSRSPYLASLKEEKIAVSEKLLFFLLLIRSCCSAKIRANNNYFERN